MDINKPGWNQSDQQATAYDPNQQQYYGDGSTYYDPDQAVDPNQAYYPDPNTYPDAAAYYGYGQDGQAYPQDYAQDPNQAYYADPNAYQDPNAYTDPYYVTSTDPNAYYGQVDNVPALEASDLAYEVTPQEQAAEQELFSEPETKVIREIHEFPFEKIRSYFQTDFDSYNSRLTQLKDKLDNAIFSMRKAIKSV